MRLLANFKGKKVNIYFSENSLLAPIHDVTLKDLGSNFFEIKSSDNTINKIYSISSIISVEECQEPKPYYGPSGNNL